MLTITDREKCQRLSDEAEASIARQRTKIKLLDGLVEFHENMIASADKHGLTIPSDHRTTTLQLIAKSKAVSAKETKKLDAIEKKLTLMKAKYLEGGKG